VVSRSRWFVGSSRRRMSEGVEMVRRLVEEEDVGGGDELARQPDPPSLAAAQLVEWLLTSCGRVEAQSLQHRVDPRGDRVAALLLEPLEVTSVSRQCCVIA
jgi:hypothetical protein